MNNYVQLKSILDSDIVIVIAAICFIVIIFAVGFCVGRIMKIKNIEDKWDKQLKKSEKAINDILEKEGIFKEITLKRED
ncbi:MAG: hypothetical protein KAW56_07980 [Candidatus Marinimicrobia bacterium]|nr:hypothetical protein [Candidatus Neomarinimicrobiota bacterium]